MRLSIWQEFSSNNSARFTVVGLFESPEKAQAARETLNGLFRFIEEWYARPENAQAREELRYGNADPTPPEIQSAKQYGVVGLSA